MEGTVEGLAIEAVRWTAPTRILNYHTSEVARSNLIDKGAPCPTLRRPPQVCTKFADFLKPFTLLHWPGNQLHLGHAFFGYGLQESRGAPLPPPSGQRTTLGAPPLVLNCATNSCHVHVCCPFTLISPAPLAPPRSAPQAIAQQPVGCRFVGGKWAGAAASKTSLEGEGGGRGRGLAFVEVEGG